MSYSRTLRVLVIEDDPLNVQTYRDACEIVRAEGFDVEDPVCAGGFDEAVIQIRRQMPFHVVILDIKLPQSAGGCADSFHGSGLDLIEPLASRDDYPVPVLLILTGQEKRVHDFGQLIDRMRASFYSANIVGKSSDVVAPIRSALEAAQKYVDFGLRLVDVEERPRPPLTGREEDLIRRYGLSQNDTFSGTDLRWWGSARKDYGAGGETPVWSKILFGRFAVRGHDMMSRPYFLKLESKDNGARSSKAAQTLAAIRSHGAVQAHLESDTRSLLVTAQATRSDHDPIGLESFLRRPPEEVEGLLPQVAEDIALDVAYGTPTTEPHPRSALLWRFHKSQEAAYDELWSSFSGEEAIKPSSLIGRFFEADVTDWIPWRACLHGDLHLGNVALDEDAGVVRAAVFDPGSMEAGACGRDIATLEVSLILHQTAAEPGILHVCRHLYDGSWADGTHPIQPGGSDIAVNTGRLLSLLREKALQESAVSVYRRLLLDSALIQLGSLLYGLSGNKIQRQPEAVELYRCLARWELEENGDI